MILGIETSCDDTAAALITQDGTCLAHKKASQIDVHKAWGGIVPNLAAREHTNLLPPLIEQLFDDAGGAVQDLKAVAATCGPGLIGSLLVGATFGKAVAMGLNIPFLSINHLEAHGLVPLYKTNLTFPYLLLLISGGHTQFFLMRDLEDYHLLGETLDDALGEAFDKVARLLGLGYPGGPALEECAQTGNPQAFSLPAPLKGRPDCNFSFSGLKTAMAQLVTRHKDALADPSSSCQADMAASFQATIGTVLEDRLKYAVTLARKRAPTLAHLVISGGVAANQNLRNRLHKAAQQNSMKLTVPPAEWCTDNGLMVAWAGLMRYKTGRVPALKDALAFEPRARWPLARITQEKEVMS